MAATPPFDRRLTAEEFYAFEDAKGYELVDGWLVPRNGTTTSSMVGLRVGAVLGTAARHVHGEFFGAGLGIRVNAAEPDTVRRASLSFVSKDRLPHADTPFLDLVPDFVVEVVSRLASVEHVQSKIDYWLRFGAGVVWVVQPTSREVYVYRKGAVPQVFIGDMVISAADVLPGVSAPVSSFFEPA